VPSDSTRPQKRFLQALQGQKTDRPPFWYMRQAGRYLPEYRALRAEAGSFLSLCYAPDFAVEVTLQPLRRYQMDAAILFSDILVIPHALGQSLDFVQGEGPVLEPIDHEEKLKTLSLEGIHEHLNPVYETVERLSKDIPSTTALIGFAGAPWTVATYMVGGRGSADQAAARLWAYRAPDSFQKLIDLLVDATASYLIEQVNRGAEALQIFDSWAGNLPETEFARWSIAPIRAVVKKVKQVYPDIPIIGFPKGAGENYIRFFKETGVQAIGLDTSVPVEWARDHLQKLGPVQGNLDPLLLVSGGDEMLSVARRIIETFQDGPFIFNLGHGIVQHTPPEHVDELSTFIREWKR